VLNDASRSLEDGSREAKRIALCTAILKDRLVMTIFLNCSAQPALLFCPRLRHHVRKQLADGIQTSTSR
jgi:hypothetical protein